MDGALITMPHKSRTLALVDDASLAAKVSGACNAVVRRADGTLFGDLFDGVGFVAALGARDFIFAGASCHIVGAGGVGRAIAGSLAAEGVASIRIVDVDEGVATAVCGHLGEHFPATAFSPGRAPLSGQDLVVNATPLGSRPGDPLPFEVDGLSPEAFVADVVMTKGTTPLIAAATGRGCRVQPGIDMLFAQIPRYLELFGFGQVPQAELRAVAQL